MYAIFSKTHYLGHCGAEGQGSKIVGKCEDTGFKSRQEAQQWIEGAKEDPGLHCTLCGRYNGTVSNPAYWYVIGYEEI